METGVRFRVRLRVGVGVGVGIRVRVRFGAMSCSIETASMCAENMSSETPG